MQEADDCLAGGRFAAVAMQPLKGKRLVRNFVISTAQHPNCLDFPFYLPLVPCLYHALPSSDYMVLLVGADCTLDWVSKHLQGIRLHKLQFTP